MENYFEVDDNYCNHSYHEVPYEDKGIVDRAYDTLERLGFFAWDNEELIECFRPIGFSEQDIAELIKEFNELALLNVDPIENIDDRAHAVAYLIESMIEELEEEQKQEETIE